MPVSNNSIPSTEKKTMVEDEVSVVNILNDNPVRIEEQHERKSVKIHGLSAAELADPNNISVTISDTEAPLVILFGPPSCGKTMTLVRMTRYLKTMSYKIQPIRTFRPTYDTNYSEICNSFDETINSEDAAEATDRVSFMLVEVLEGNGRRICQILEAPGEYYFNPQKPNDSFPNYVNTIIASPNRKIWAIMVEPNWGNQPDRDNYATKISNLVPKMGLDDSVVFIYNKIDLTQFVRRKGDVDSRLAFSQVKFDYKNIFVPFVNKNPITKIFREYNCDFVPFQTGTYTGVNSIKFQAGADVYCEKLWKCIKSKIIG